MSIGRTEPIESETGTRPVWEPFGADSWRDPYPTYRRLRDEDPVHFSEKHKIWVLTRFAYVYAAALDSSTFSSAQGISLRNEHEHLALLPSMVMTDPPVHTRYRRLVNRGFSPRNVNTLEPDLRRYVRERLASLCEGGSGDLVAELARPVPCFVVAHYLGVPFSDRSRFEGWTRAIVGGNATGRLSDAGAALRDLYCYFTELLERLRKEPGDDMLSDLLRYEAQESSGDERLTTDEILGYAFVMVAGGNDTTTGLIAGTAELLSDNPTERRKLLADPSLIGTAVEEFLRLTTPVQGLCRVTTRDTDVGGVPIPSASRVMLCYGAANRDPREFGPDSDELDVTRRVKRHLTFASGVHHCLGSYAARLQGRVVVEELLDLCPDFSVDTSAGVFADGAFTRRYESLPFEANIQ
jgi:cytochrome P450 family 130